MRFPIMSSSRIKYCAYSVVIIILLINVVSLEAGRSRGGGWRGGSSGSRGSSSSGSRGSSSGGHRGGGGIFGGGSHNPPRTPVHQPKPPPYSPPVHVPRPPPYSPPVHQPKPPPYTPPKANPPTVPHTPVPTNPKDSSDIFIKSEGGRRPLPGSTTGAQSPHQPSAPIHDPAIKVNAGTQQNAPNQNGNYPIWGNPHANPNAPSNNPNPFPNHPNSGKPPSAPFPPIHPPGPISNVPIIPPHNNAPHGISPHQPHGNPPPYQSPPPYPVGHPQNMPMPSPPHIGFGNTGHTGSQHPPPYPYPPLGSPHMSPHGGGSPQTQIINHNYGGVPPVGSPQNPVGHPTYVHQPVYGGATMGQPIPSQTILLMPNQQSSGPGFGQILKEAVIHSTVNAAVNRVVFGAPHHYHHDGYQQPPPASPAGSTSTVTNTVIYNGYPGANAGPMPLPAQPGTPPGSPPTFPNVPTGNLPAGSVSPGNFPPGNIPVAPGVMNPNIGVPAAGSPNSNVQNPNPSSTGTPSSPMVPVNNDNKTVTEQTNLANPTNEAVPESYVPQYYISNDELGNLTESLFKMDELNASTYITLNLQRRSLGPNDTTDLASAPLLLVQKAAHDLSTIQALRDLYDGYEFNSEKKELMDQTQRRKENVMLDVFLNTDVIVTAMQWLSEKGYVENDDFEWKDTLRRIWMTKVSGSTSGLERIFLAEKYPGPTVFGAQNWIYFDYQESMKRINYLSYVDKIELGDKASLLKVNFKIDDVLQPNTTMLVGTPPELEMALYTICYYTRPNVACPVSLGGLRFNVYTHASRYFGKDLIDFGFIFV